MTAELKSLTSVMTAPAAATLVAFVTSALASIPSSLVKLADDIKPEALVEELGIDRVSPVKTNGVPTTRLVSSLISTSPTVIS